jgi:chromosome segregation ATPase
VDKGISLERACNLPEGSFHMNIQETKAAFIAELEESRKNDPDYLRSQIENLEAELAEERNRLIWAKETEDHLREVLTNWQKVISELEPYKTEALALRRRLPLTVLSRKLGEALVALGRLLQNDWVK